MSTPVAVASSKTTVDDLVKGLRRTRYKMYNMKSDGQTLNKKASRMLTPGQTVGYFNQCFQMDLDVKSKNEDEMACMLYDLANVPLQMVKERQYNELFSIGNL